MRTLAREIDALWRNRSLVWLLARRDLATRHAASAGGIGWAYVQPMVLIAAYYILFDIVFGMRVGDGAARHRPAGQFLIVGALAWMAFSDAISRATGALVEAGSLLQKNALPAILFPVRAVLASAIVFVPLTGVTAVVYVNQHGGAHAIIGAVMLVLLQTALCVTLGYLLAVLTAALRDVQQIVTFLLSIGIFLSPVLFPVSMFPADWRWALWLNPMTPLVIGYQSLLLDGTWPAFPVWLVPLAWIALALVLLDRALSRSREYLVDWL